MADGDVGQGSLVTQCQCDSLHQSEEGWGGEGGKGMGGGSGRGREGRGGVGWLQRCVRVRARKQFLRACRCLLPTLGFYNFKFGGMNFRGIWSATLLDEEVEAELPSTAVS